MRLAVLGLIVALAVPGLAAAQARPPAPPPDMMAAPDSPGWIVDARSGCWVWNPNPQPNETITWSGSCGPDGRATGRGTLQWLKDGKPNDRYEGEYRDGKQHGRGVYTWANGDRYEGEYRDDKKHGRGVLTGANGNRYDGEFRDGKRHGRGVWTGADGDRYEGEYRDGKQHGRGVYIWADGERYDGEFRDDKQHGRGVYTWANGSRYDGEFRDDKADGYGEYWNAAQRETYVGQWAGGCYRNGVVSASIGRPLSECP